MLTLVVFENGLVMFSAKFHSSIWGTPITLAPLNNTSIVLDTLLKLSLCGGLKVSGFCKVFSKPLSVLFILKTWSIKVLYSKNNIWTKSLS